MRAGEPRLTGWFTFANGLAVLALVVAYLVGGWGLATGAALVGLAQVVFSASDIREDVLLLARLPAFWQRFFMATGLILAALVVRLLLPLMVVSVALHADPLRVLHMSIADPRRYADTVARVQPLIAAGAGVFLLLSCLEFPVRVIDRWSGRSVVVAKATVVVVFLVSASLIFGRAHRIGVCVAGVCGLVVYLLVRRSLGGLGLDDRIPDGRPKGILRARDAFTGYLTLELLDAMLSLDAVSSAFAVDVSVVGIFLGLVVGSAYLRAVGVRFTRSGTLSDLDFMDVGRAFAAGALAILCLVEIAATVPGWFPRFVAFTVLAVVILFAVISGSARSLRGYRIEYDSPLYAGIAHQHGMPRVEVDVPDEFFLNARGPSRCRPGDEVSVIVRVLRGPTLTELAGVMAVFGSPAPPVGSAITLIAESDDDLEPLEPLQAVTTVVATGDPPPVRFAFRAGAEGTFQVRVSAWAGGTFLAEVDVHVAVAHRAAAPSTAEKTSRMRGTAARPGEVSLQVRRLRGGAGDAYEFQLLAKDVWFESVSTTLSTRFDDAVTRAVDYLDKIASGDRRYVRNADLWMQNLGKELWREMLPREIIEQFADLGRGTEALSIVTADDVAPWELLHPDDGEDLFLVERFPVTRRMYGLYDTSHLVLNPAVYIQPPNAPSDAGTEIARIIETLSAAPDDSVVIDDVRSLLSRIAAGDSGLFHFACHNAFGAGGSEIAMADGVFAPPLLTNAVSSHSLKPGSVVFINACHSAGAVEGFVDLSGWAHKFLAAGAAAFIGTNWAVRTAASSEFAAALYEQLTRGATLGAAAHQARRSLRSAEDPSWLAYSVYGSAAARVPPRSPWRPTDVPPRARS